ncbi:MAG TPA: DUF1801 domain-containing protein [Saprospiraceae bacterium]|nr:DUF1801 domain-containing protein [Saprospiraceae bacterium]HRG21053.1 DUF1801 domain-containing protein [Saprospiraceae bacterium]
MQSKATTVEEYLNELPEDRIAAMLQLQKTIKKNLPKGFSEEMNYGMLGYVVPHKLYPAGYHCDPKLPLPFLAIASQKNFIAIYHMGIYADPRLLDWFTKAYAELNIGKLDMGKSCIRFKNPAKIPFDLIGELVSKMSPQQWIAMYESYYKK